MGPRPPQPEALPLQPLRPDAPATHPTTPPANADKPLSRHEHELAALLFACGPLSRRDIVERTGIHPNLVGNAASRLIQRRIAREIRPAHPDAPDGPTALAAPRRRPQRSAGRPRLPLEIDPNARHVLGVALRPGQVSATRLNLLGRPLEADPAGPTAALSARTGPQLTEAAARLLARLVTPDTFAVGVTVPGILDPDRQHLLLSAASPDTRGLDLSPLHLAAGHTPLLLHNDMHALAARWQLTAHAPPHEDVLLAYIADGSIGASLLFSGRPNGGCVIAAAELGHWQTGRPTPVCFCGRRGCLERVFSAAFLHTGNLDAALAHDPDPAGITTTLAVALADAAHLVRPHRLVIASPFAASPAFRDRLAALLRGHLLPGLVERIRLDWWPQPLLATPDTAAYLALSSLYRPAWS